MPLVPELTLVLPKGARAGTVVKRDGVVMVDISLGGALPVDPGEHVVTTQAPGGPVWEQRITLNKGEKKQLMLEVKPALEAEAQPPKGHEGAGGRRLATYVVGGVGIAGLVLGGVTGGLTLGKKGTINAHCGSRIGLKDEAECDQTGLDATSSAKTLALVSSVSFAAGAAGLGAAAVLLLTESSRPKPTEGRRRRWISAGMLEASPAGAVVGVRGGW